MCVCVVAIANHLLAKGMDALASAPHEKRLAAPLKQRREFQGGKEMVKTTIKKNRAGEEVWQVTLGMQHICNCPTI